MCEGDRLVNSCTRSRSSSSSSDVGALKVAVCLVAAVAVDAERQASIRSGDTGRRRRCTWLAAFSACRLEEGRNSRLMANDTAEYNAGKRREKEQEQNGRCDAMHVKLRVRSASSGRQKPVSAESASFPSIHPQLRRPRPSSCHHVVPLPCPGLADTQSPHPQLEANTGTAVASTASITARLLANCDLHASDGGKRALAGPIQHRPLVSRLPRECSADGGPHGLPAQPPCADRAGRAGKGSRQAP